MPIKKSDLYVSLWASCDQLRGGMDASQYKDYVLFMLFIKYISDKYADSDDFAMPVVIPKGASFQDMVALKGKPDIGDKINTQIIQPLIDANAKVSTTAYDPTCGSGSLLLKVAAKAGNKITLEGQEKDVSTANYSQLQQPIAQVKAAIVGDAEFTAFRAKAAELFADWQTRNGPRMKALPQGGHPKALIETLSEDRGWTCDLIPKALIVARYFAKEQAAIDGLQAELDTALASQTELEEDQAGDDGVFAGYDSITAVAVKERMREIGGDTDGADEFKLLKTWLDLGTRIAALKKQARDAEAALDALTYAKYPVLIQPEIHSLVITDKWMATLASAVHGELDRVSQTLTRRIRELAERYAVPLPKLTDEVVALAPRVEQHLKRMGVAWT